VTGSGCDGGSAFVVGRAPFCWDIPTAMINVGCPKSVHQPDDLREEALINKGSWEFLYFRAS
jgi:hypothetical protein